MKKDERVFFETQKRAIYFYKERVEVHIKLKSGTFYNGTIIEVSEGDFLIFMDRFCGELPIFFTEIERIERFVEK